MSKNKNSETVVANEVPPVVQSETVVKTVEKRKSMRTGIPVAVANLVILHGIEVSKNDVPDVERIHTETGFEGPELGVAVRKDYAAKMKEATLKGMRETGFLPEGYRTGEGLKNFIKRQAAEKELAGQKV